MIARRSVRHLVAITSTVALSVTGCAFGGLNSLPLPGTVGHGPGASTYHVEVANVGTLESNSPVLVSDVVVGSVGKMTVRDWHADVEVSVKPDVTIPANAVASVGQTSLLGSMHLALNPPLGQAPTGKLHPGRDDRTEPLLDVSVDRADPFGAVGGRQRRGTGPDRRHRPGIQRSAQRPPGQDPRPADPAERLRRPARHPAGQHQRLHRVVEPTRRNLRRADAMSSPRR